MIITRTPFRVSFAGGGSDLRSFYREEPGAVLSTAIPSAMLATITVPASRGMPRIPMAANAASGDGFYQHAAAKRFCGLVGGYGCRCTCQVSLQWFVPSLKQPPCQLLPGSVSRTV